ncbi:MAG: ATP-binding protein [Bacteroidia bacterium]|nr:ATP-binding protein [Bacteroidia bacterium]
MDRQLLKKILLNNQERIEKQELIVRDFTFDDFACYVLVGVRRSGKSFLLYQRMKTLLDNGKDWSDMLYLNFEDERLEGFSSDDFNSILEIHLELYGKKPILFLDEIQNVNGWHKFARRIADEKYISYITGSNAKMLSQEVMTTLGGRYISKDVYPFSFKEYLTALHIPYDELSLIKTNTKTQVINAFSEYFTNGGLPETLRLTEKRDYISSVYQKIYLGDVIARNNIENINGVKLLIKKIAESVMQPISYNRLQRILSSVGGRISLASIIKYLDGILDSWLLFKIQNIASSISEKETVCKYYFVDNGIFNLFFLENNTGLLENLVALTLVKKYGRESQVFYYNKGVEVDFYIPEEEQAIQVSYSIKDFNTYEREVGALYKISKALSCKKRTIITYDEEQTISDKYGEIDVVPIWKYLLEA